MENPKMTDEDKARFLALVPDRPDVVVKPMFGNLGAYVNGNMFMGSFGADVGVKLSAEDRDALLAIEGAGPFGPTERPMGGYVTLPSAWRSPRSKATSWISRSLEYVAEMPPKAAKPQKQRA